MKLGTFFSNCDGVIGGTLDLVSLSKHYESLGPVKIVESFYDVEDLDALLAVVGENNLDSVILAGESPFAYQRARNGDYLFKCLAKQGVNPNRIQVVNLKNMVVLPHKGADKSDLALKAKLLLDVGIEKLKHAHDLETLEITPRKSAAVVGANLSGIALSQHLLDQGCKVYMIQKKEAIDLPDDELPHIQPTLAYVRHHPRFELINAADVDDFFGYTGDYTLVLSSHEKKRKLNVGAVVLSPDEDDEEMLKTAHHVFHVDVKAEGGLISRDEISARSRTLDMGVFIINPPKTEGNGVLTKFITADAAAAAIIDLLNQPEILNSITISEVDTDLCSGCSICVKSCMFQAISLQGAPPVSVIDPKRCRGCGNCVAICPSDARSLAVSPTSFLFSAVEVLSGFKPSNNATRSLILTCDGCGYPCLDRAGRAGMTWPVGALVLRMVCGGQMDTQLIMHAFIHGFDHVVLMVCGEGLCHNIIGNVELERRVNLFRGILDSRGIDSERVHVITTSTRGDEACIDELNRICK